MQQDADLDLASAKQLEAVAKDQKTRKDRAETDLRKFYDGVLPKDFAGARRHHELLARPHRRSFEPEVACRRASTPHQSATAG